MRCRPTRRHSPALIEGSELEEPRLSKTVELGIGSAYGIVRDNPTYKYQVYGRLSFYF